jgi:hypothetical protein
MVFDQHILDINHGDFYFWGYLRNKTYNSSPKTGEN